MAKKKVQSDKKGLDLFESLNNLSNADIAWFNSLSQTDKKSLAPVVVMRWLTGCSDKTQVQFINHFVNPYVFSLYNHPDLLFKLMMASSTGSSKRYHWLKKGPQTKKAEKEMQIIMQYCNIGYREAREYYPMLNEDDIKMMTDELGVND